MNCFIDTSAFLAVLNRDDDNHEKAAKIWRKLIEEDWQLTTSSYVLVETFALCQNRMGIKAAQTLHNDIIPIVNIVWVDAAIHQAAALAVLTAGRKKLSLVDCASFEVMRLSGVTKAFAFDRHFSAHGFELL